MWKGVLVGIYIAPDAGKQTVSLAEARAVIGRGLEGDRYYHERGFYSKRPGRPHSPLTLIETEAIEALQRDNGITLKVGDARRNLVTRGVPLNHLVGKEFFVGDVLIQGTKLCEPCVHLEELTQKGVLGGLVHRGGIDARILTDGVLRVGDTIRPNTDGEQSRDVT